MNASRGQAAPFWDGCAAGELRLVRCDDCGAFEHLAPTRCRRCHGTNLDWVAAKGTGRIASFTVVRRAPSQGLRALVPYGVALIDLDEGVRVMARLAGDPRAWRIGAAVSLCFVSADGAPGAPPTPRLPAFTTGEEGA